MQTDDDQSQMNQERKKTDKSLQIERHETDESLEKFEQLNEKQTDASVRSKRSSMDAERDEIRADLDLIQKREQETREPSLVTERKFANNQRQTEREQTDETIQEERKVVDETIKRERDNKRRLEQTLLSKERNETDRDLAHERFQTDADFQKSSKTLNEEQQAHLGTKAELLTRNEFLAIVSHDLRNPIGTVLTCSDLLLEDLSSLTIDPAVLQLVHIIKRNAETAIRLISDLLDLERISAGKLELLYGEYDIYELVRQAAENFSHLAKAKSIRLRVDLPDTALRINCDQDRIMQVLSNLISNALKFTPDHGSVTLQARAVEPHDIEVSISDTGPGIPAELRDTIFERFSQLRQKDREGLGLGLYISTKIIDAHRGKLWVRSIDGEGSRFTFTLPIAGPIADHPLS